MGRVFSFSQIKNGQVPEPSGFGPFVKFLRLELPRAPGFQTAVFFGSIPRGDYSRRSDCDVLLLYEDGQEQKMMAFCANLHKEARRRYIPLELITVPLGLLEGRGDSLKFYFRRHILSAAEKNGALIGTPLPPIFSSSLPWYGKEAAVQNYLQFVMNRLRKWWNKYGSYSNDPDYFRFMGKLLSVSVYAARMMIETCNIKLPVDSKSEVVRTYCGWMKEGGPLKQSGTNHSALLDRAMILDRAYDSLLDEQLQALNYKKYQKFFDRLHCSKAISEVLLFLELNARFLV